MVQDKDYFAFINCQRKDEEWADRLEGLLVETPMHSTAIPLAYCSHTIGWFYPYSDLTQNSMGRV